MYRIILLVFLISFASCKSKEVLVPIVEEKSYSYLHISHTRTASNSAVFPEVENIDYSKFDILCLGGDMAYLTSLDEATMGTTDSIFNLSDSNTLWSLGNHDYSNLALVEEYTGRPPYYAYNKNGITFIVLDTQDSLSNIVGEQLNFFNSVMDSLTESTHLIVLSHKLIWMYSHPELNSEIDSISNGVFGDCFYCINPNNFYEDLYPRLIEAKQGGIEVICLAGDIGIKVKDFYYLTDEEITFLASGLSYTETLNYAILFKHNVSKNELTWEFKLLDDL